MHSHRTNCAANELLSPAHDIQIDGFRYFERERNDFILQTKMPEIDDLRADLTSYISYIPGDIINAIKLFMYEIDCTRSPYNYASTYNGELHGPCIDCTTGFYTAIKDPECRPTYDKAIMSLFNIRPYIPSDLVKSSEYPGYTLTFEFAHVPCIITCTYYKGKRHGNYVLYDQHNYKRKSIEYMHGAIHGHYLEWESNNVLTSHLQFISGVMSGPQYMCLNGICKDFIV